MKQLLPVSTRSTRAWLLWMCLFSHWVCVAQSERFTLQGKVSDQAGQGLPGITVLLEGTTFGAATGADGNYTFEAAIAPGTYALVFSSPGYGTQNETGISCPTRGPNGKTTRQRPWTRQFSTL